MAIVNPSLSIITLDLNGQKFPNQDMWSHLCVESRIMVIRYGKKERYDPSAQSYSHIGRLCLEMIILVNNTVLNSGNLLRECISGKFLSHK